VQLGISLRGIRRLRARLVEMCASETSPFAKDTTLLGRDCPGVRSFKQLTTTHLVYKWVKDEAVTGIRRLAEVPHLVDPADVGLPTYFVSHAWQSTVAKLFDTIEAFLADAADDICVWLDFVAINQHPIAQNKEDVDSFAACLKACSGGTLVVVDHESCNPAKRGWCLFEWDFTLVFHGPDGLHMRGMRLEDMDIIVRCIKVEDAQCQCPEDLKMILGNILQHHHSFDAFDMQLKLQLVLDPLSYKVDIEQQGRRSVDTQWQWESVRKFLEQAPEHGRVLCILAGELEAYMCISLSCEMNFAAAS
jgi:hypothetical protein